MRHGRSGIAIDISGSADPCEMRALSRREPRHRRKRFWSAFTPSVRCRRKISSTRDNVHVDIVDAPIGENATEEVLHRCDGGADGVIAVWRSCKARGSVPRSPRIGGWDDHNRHAAVLGAEKLSTSSGVFYLKWRESCRRRLFIGGGAPERFGFP